MLRYCLPCSGGCWRNFSLRFHQVSTRTKSRVGCVHRISVFFSSSKSKHVFHKHLNFLVTKFKNSQGRFLSRFFTEEGIPLAFQLKSLRSFLFLGSQSDESLLVQLLAEFPSLLVPLSNDIQVKVENGVTFSGNCQA
ncbi:uncharacterized protein At3g06530-like isoform X2 [Impatiens glandulifera]|uniref:uncharacterized protein At3g06530-like isoform X2 n=1 Tax=Impatiens glandulifera TaxID=253017 RepID=UPI001FB0FCA3|nr:uncharacterized protein At3g06530-like isoform X2 [Impatiens glandulifera]